MTSADGQAAFGSDLLVTLLAHLGIEYVALNPGATFRGLHDSLVHVEGAPAVVTCLHEEIAVAAAHGYAKAAGHPMAAAVHDVVGLQHACMAVYNAWCDRVPLLLLGGTGPVAAERRRPWIDWIHTALVQGNHVRDFVKWDDQPASVAAAVESIVRAHKLATAAPRAPTYVCLPVEVQEEPTSALDLPDPAAYRPARTGPDPAAVEEAARHLRDARSPVIVLDRAADYVGALERAAELAHILGAPMIDLGARMNVSTEDPLDLTGAESDVLGSADVVLAVEVLDLEGTLHEYTHPRPTRIHISLADSLVGSWTSDYQRLAAVDIPIAADAGLALDALVEACRGVPARVAAERAERAFAVRARLRTEWQRATEAAWHASPISLPRLADELWTALSSRSWVLAHGTLDGWARRRWQWVAPGSYLGTSGGGGIGYGPGAAIGAALAHRGDSRIIVNLQPDGDLLFAPSALWTMANLGLPILNVVWNNRSYYNSELHARRIAKHRGRPQDRVQVGIGIRDPEVDFAGLARSYGVWAEGPVIDPRDLPAVLARAVDTVANGGPALIDVVAQPR